MPPLPPLKALAGLRGRRPGSKSFKAAASEIHVTPAAVSQQIRGLEEMTRHRPVPRLPREMRIDGSRRESGAGPC